MCGADCNLRVDVWVIYPVLLVISVAGLVALVRWQLTRRAP
jgi:DNA-binding transcriptional regulator of glucitol operon